MKKTERNDFKMKIIVDAFGGDNAPLEVIKGSAMAVEKLGVEIVLAGDGDIIKKVAAENQISLNNISIIDAIPITKVITVCVLYPFVGLILPKLVTTQK